MKTIFFSISRSFYYKHCCSSASCLLQKCPGHLNYGLADSAAVAITTTDLVSKSVAVETKVITTDALVTSGQIVFPLLIAMRLFNFKRVWMLYVMQGLAKSIAWDGEGATCLIEVTVTGAGEEAEAAKIAHSVASSSLVKVW
ncbi:hypothetical protein GW17_00055410 [Ensete ventricosum]|nr:hypothetical protein GW17_00055410 [Ensete ventricosum]